MPIKGDSWFDDDGQLDFEEVQEDTSWLADMAGVAQRRTTNKLLKQQQKEREAARRRYDKLIDCPYCGGKLPKIGVEICMHCRKELAWVKYRHPCKPGEEEITLQKIKERKKREARQEWERDKREHRQRVAAERKAAEFKKRMRPWNIGAWLFIITFVLAIGLMSEFNLINSLYPPLIVAGIVTSIYAFVLWWRR